MNEDELASMSNLVAEIFRIEKSASLEASIPPFLSFLKWTTKAGAQQDSLKRAIKAWFTRAQKPAKLIDDNDAIEEMALEEIEPMLSERIQKWTDELIQKEGLKGSPRVRSRVLPRVRPRAAPRDLWRGTPFSKLDGLRWNLASHRIQSKNQS